MPEPMSLATSGLADALEALGWDGQPSVLSIEVQTLSGTYLGRAEVHVKPLTAVVRGGHAYEVTPTAFLAALRGTEAADGRDRL